MKRLASVNMRTILWGGGFLMAIAVVGLVYLLGHEIVWFGVYGTVALIACALIIFGTFFTLDGRLDFLVPLWAFANPAAYALLSFPWEKPIFTFDRMVVIMMGVALVFVPRKRTVPLPRSLHTAAWPWLLFLLAAEASVYIAGKNNAVGANRLLIESFIFPAIMALYVIKVFSILPRLRWIHLAVCGAAFYSAVIAVLEIITDTDLLEMPVRTFNYGSDLGFYARGNGPFATNESLALIGLMMFVAIVFLRRAIAQQDPWLEQTLGFRLVHWIGAGSAVTMMLCPQFRAMALAWLLILCIDLYQRGTFRARFAAVGFVVVVVMSIISIRVLAPEFFEYRFAEQSDVYARVAQQVQTWKLIKENPVIGVGFSNFMDEIQKINSTSYNGVDSVASAHNTLASLLAETGLVGLLPYLAANAYLFLAFWRLDRWRPNARLARKSFLFLVIAYWLTASTLTSGYDRDINLWYMFIAALMYNYGALDDGSGTEAATVMAGESLGEPAAVLAP